MRRVLCVVLLLASTVIAGPVLAGYQEGLNAFSEGDYAKAMREWRAVVDGPADAVVPPIYAETHYAIATLYWRGLGVEQDYDRAREWLLRAAELDHAGAQAKLGFMYTDGLSVRQDYAQALEWYRKSARGGDPDGLYNLGIFYLYGWGVEPDRAMAKQYLASASALGDVASEDALQQLMAEEAAEEAARQAAAEAAADEAFPQRWEPDAIVLEELPGEVEQALGDAEDALTPAEPETETSLAEEPEPEQAAVVRDEAWILAQDPTHYTIQVMALDSAERVLGVIDGYERLAPYAIYRLANEGRPLFVLVQGVYEEVEAARAARDAFPRAVQRPSGVWIRKFGKVQELIRAERDE
jgi:tetratricopeptide (TPR) repeat protein